MPNRLEKASSPYLLQHANNPVDWFEWGEEAFAKAKAEDKLVFLSVGYATCHWCHVMEHESFENEATAKILNEHCVSIKVDREERPDIDNIYMTVVQAFTGGHGGWPMSLFLAPDQRPVFGATYLPPDSRYGRAGFTTVIKELARLWREERPKLLEQATSVTEWLNKQGAPENPGALDKGAFKRFADAMRAMYDEERGGFGRAPKFPRPHAPALLLRRHQSTGDKVDLAMVERTAEAMWRGGIHDHLGGGFHRYSTDAHWLLPHFEKMLYDQALLLDLYRELWQITQKPLYAQACRDIVGYVLRDLRDKDGAFHSAEDADSEGVEGKFYVWTLAELQSVLGEAEGKAVAAAYGCTDNGNFLDEATREQSGANILHLPQASDEDRFKAAREKLLAARSKRVRPLLDDKVLADWNGLFIGACARAGAALGESAWIKAATEAATFILGTMVKDGRLLHRYRSGQAGILGYVDDYAFLANGLLDLYESTFETRWLAEAARLCREMLKLFRDDSEKVFHTQGKDDPEKLIAASRSFYDGAIPSGNAAACHALIRVGRLIQDEALVNAARETLEAFAGEFNARPESHPCALTAVDLLLEPMQEIVIAGNASDAATQALVKILQARFLPRAVFCLHEQGGEIEKLAPFVKTQGPIDGKPAAYVCENNACQTPVSTPEAFAKLLH
ncbi:MAG: thioredoxin domain-containing protein [Planctomycetes bacterium]|nr:thioredoxin domain-containing protein [Planctomycetota bacterium]